mmetsp:Transcript_30684/g.74763  ORF Transcript_30684/g.74763 Transcript_30684/m.74763 type:complete len:453 (+) Transcript_30684:144-1502(+)
MTTEDGFNAAEIRLAIAMSMTGCKETEGTQPVSAQGNDNEEQKDSSVGLQQSVEEGNKRCIFNASEEIGHVDKPQSQTQTHGKRKRKQPDIKEFHRKISNGDQDSIAKILAEGSDSSEDWKMTRHFLLHWSFFGVPPENENEYSDEKCKSIQTSAKASYNLLVKVPPSLREQILNSTCTGNRQVTLGHSADCNDEGASASSRNPGVLLEKILPEENALYWAIESKSRKVILPVVWDAISKWAYLSSAKDIVANHDAAVKISDELKLIVVNHAARLAYGRCSRLQHAEVVELLVRSCGIDLLTSDIDGTNPEPKPIEKAFWYWVQGRGWTLRRVQMPGFAAETQRENAFGILNQFSNKARLRQFDWRKDVEGGAEASKIEKSVIVGQRGFASNLLGILGQHLKQDKFCVDLVCSFVEFLDVFPKLSREHQANIQRKQRKAARKKKKKKRLFIL